MTRIVTALHENETHWIGKVFAQKVLVTEDRTSNSNPDTNFIVIFVEFAKACATSLSLHANRFIDILR